MESLAKHGMYKSRWQQVELSFYGLLRAMTPQDGEKKKKREKKKS
jgi:hypothetical protein